MQSEDVLRAWRVNLAEFGRRNHLRPTRIEVVEPSTGLESDFYRVAILGILRLCQTFLS